MRKTARFMVLEALCHMSVTVAALGALFMYIDYMPRKGAVMFVVGVVYIALFLLANSNERCRRER